MSYLATFHAGDVGTIIRVTVQERNDTTGALTAVDITNATTKNLIFRTPGRVKIEKAGTFTNTGSDGKLQYAVEAGFFDQKDKALLGKWSVQVQLAGLGSWSGYSNVVSPAFELLPTSE